MYPGVHKNIKKLNCLNIINNNVLNILKYSTIILNGSNIHNITVITVFLINSIHLVGIRYLFSKPLQIYINTNIVYINL